MRDLGKRAEWVEIGSTKRNLMNKSKKDEVNNPLHYTSGGIETIDYQKAKATPEEFRGHLRLTALKYLSRAGLKDDTLKDLKKAQWYVNRLVQFVETGK